MDKILFELLKTIAIQKAKDALKKKAEESATSERGSGGAEKPSSPSSSGGNKSKNIEEDPAAGFDSEAKGKGKGEGSDIAEQAKDLLGGARGSGSGGGSGGAQYPCIDSDTTSRIQSLIGSDINIKDIGVDPKDYIGAIIKHGKKFGPKDVKVAFDAFGIGGDDDGSENTLKGYAEHIFNYPYKYKEEAKQLDPSIDTEKEHIGPMAQDIESVNPACVVTDDKTGYKSVDTSRLALMNAGAIGDLAREIFKLQEAAHGG